MLQQKERTAYINYKQYAVRYDIKTHTFSCWYSPMGRIIEDAGISQICSKDGNILLTLADYTKTDWDIQDGMDNACLSIHYTGGPAEQKELVISFILSEGGVQCKADSRGDLDVRITGQLHWGADMEHDTFSVCLDRQGQDFRSALGPASSAVDNALFDRASDRALEFFGYSMLRIRFDWEKRGYCFETRTEGNDYVRGFSFRAREQVYQRRFNVPYRAINKHNTFPEPPCGWMTWYAVQFDASEKTVLENARWQTENLAPFGANTIWVDWEWYHSGFGGAGPDGIHVFSCDKSRYPNDMAYVAAEIEKLGLIPAIWIGATNEPAQNEEITSDEAMVLVQRPSWCGQYFFDLSNPKYLSEYIPKVFSMIKEWGYKALKWDCLPTTLEYADGYHDSMYDPEMTSEQALRQVVQAARDTVGQDFYMLSCSGHSVRDITACIDIFDAARIGGDIFKWSEFISSCVARVMKFYSYHNVVQYNDPDNVIVRPKFNTYDQALSRVSFVSVLGLPVTLGDNLPDLPEDRVELLKRALPALDIHPMDVRELNHDFRVVKMNLSINRPFEEWNVVNVLNLLEEPVDTCVDMREDLHLDPGKYLVFDYWNREFLGIYSGRMPLKLRPFASRVLSVRKLLDRPQILSTSRHITQGGPDLEEVHWDAQRMTLSGVSRVVKNDPYELYLHLPEGCRVVTEMNDTHLANWEMVAPSVWRGVYLPDKTGEYDWSVQFDTSLSTLA